MTGSDRLSRIEGILRDERGYVVRNPDASVVLFSGGLDSTDAMTYCMEELDLEVYPLYVRRGQEDIVAEEAALADADGQHLSLETDIELT